MKKEELLDYKKRDLNLLKKVIKHIERIKPKVCYEVNNGSGNVSLVMVKTFNTDLIRFHVLASDCWKDLHEGKPKYWAGRSREWPEEETIILGSDMLDKAKEVPPEKFPLYIGMKFVSNRLAKLIKKGK